MSIDITTRREAAVQGKAYDLFAVANPDLVKTYRIRNYRDLVDDLDGSTLRPDVQAWRWIAEDLIDHDMYVETVKRQYRDLGEQARESLVRDVVCKFFLVARGIEEDHDLTYEKVAQIPERGEAWRRVFMHVFAESAAA